MFLKNIMPKLRKNKANREKLLRFKKEYQKEKKRKKAKWAAVAGKRTPFTGVET